MAVLGTQIIATLIAVYGLFMTPLGWEWAAFVWGYAVVWFLVNDRIKLIAYRIFDPAKKTGDRSETKVEHQADAKPDTEGEVKIPVRPEANMGTKTKDKADSQA